MFTCGVGEDFKIGEDIKVSLMNIQGKHVCVGFTAPKTIAIHRHEHYEKFRERAQESIHDRDELALSVQY
jgi:carbon storage regulator